MSLHRFSRRVELVEPPRDGEFFFEYEELHTDYGDSSARRRAGTFPGRYPLTTILVSIIAGVVLASVLLRH